MKNIPQTAYTFGILILIHLFTNLNAAPYPAEIAAWDEATKESQRRAGQTILKQIQAASDAGQSEILIPKGHYRFAETDGARRPSFIHFRGMTNFTIDFQGSTLWFENEATGIVTSKSDNLTIKNATLDWDPLPFTQGVVTAISPEKNTFNVRIDPGYERVVPGMAPGKDNDGRWRGVLYDAETRLIKEGQAGFALNFAWSRKNEDGTYQVKYRGFYGLPISESSMQVGDAIAIISRMRRAVRMEAGKHSTMENLTLHSSPFVAFSSSGASGDHGPIFRNCKIIRRPGTDRLLAGNADGINISNSIQQPIIENCVIENIGDDFINVHGHLARVIWQNNPTEIICSLMNYRSHITEPIEVEFLKRSTLESLGTRMVTGTTLQWTIEKDKCLADLDHRWHSGAASGLAYGAKQRLLKLTLDKPLEITGDVVITCETYSGSNAIIRNNSMMGSVARGIRMQSPGALIEKNRIAYTMGPAISLQGHAGFWGEGPYVHSAIVRNNSIAYTDLTANTKDRAAIRIVDGDYAERQIAYNISISDNTIIHSPGAAIVARGVNGLTIRDNTIKGFGERPADANALTGANHAIILQNIDGLQEQNNQINAPGPFAQGPMFKLEVSD